MEKKRFALGQTVPGTRSYHFFKPVNSNVYKRTAEDDALAGSFNITGEACFGRMTTESCVSTSMSHADTMRSEIGVVKD